MKKNIWDNQDLVKIINDGGIAVMPTDTIYGIVGKAFDRGVVERVYALKKRDFKKPFIILIGSMSELNFFGIDISDDQKLVLEKYGSLDSVEDYQLRPNSIILDCPHDKFEYLHRGTQSLAFRMPASKELRDLLLKTGPLVAPSANTEKSPASENMQDAKNYFGDKVDLYIDGGEIVGKASRIIKLQGDGSVAVLRE